MDRKTRFKKMSKTGLFVVLNVGVFLFFLFAFGREYVSNRMIEQEISALEQQRAVLEQNQLNTLALIEKLSSEYYLEGEGRVKHGLGNDGETLIVIQDTNPVSAGKREEGSGFSLGSVSAAKVWFYYFFNQGAFERLSAL